MGWGWWGEKEALMNCSGRWLRKAISGTCVRLGSIWIVQWEGFCTFFVVTVWNFRVLQRENIVFWVIIIVQEKLLLGFVQRSRAVQIITLNTEYVFFFLKKVPSQVLLLGATRELCLIALLQIAEGELLHFMWSIIDGAVCLQRIRPWHFIVASLQVYQESHSSSARPLWDAWHTIALAFLLLEGSIFSFCWRWVLYFPRAL